MRINDAHSTTAATASGRSVLPLPILLYQKHSLLIKKRKERLRE